MSTTWTGTVVGMTCGHCVASVTEELSDLPGVRSVDVVLETGQVAVTGDAPLGVEA
ncbi:MAG: heavy-metal-associated domain-containing protein, partial [Nocardioides sp.]